MAREALAITGAAIGGFIGGPSGAAIGFNVGYTVGSVIDPDVVPGPSLGEAPIQTSRDGIPLPIVWGTVHLHGNLIQAGPVNEVTRKRRSSKTQKVTETTRTQTFAIGICQGPIEGISRIWQNNMLVVDRVNHRVNLQDQGDYLEGLTEYLGTDDQLPDADLEALTGAGNQPTYRDTAYAVWPDFDITDLASSIPQYRFEVNGSADFSVSSKPYPIEVIDGIDGSSDPADSIFFNVQPEGVSTSQTPQGGTLREPLISYDNYAPEGIDSTQTPQDGTLEERLVTYDNYAPEGIDTTQTPQDGTLEVRLVDYEIDPEGITITQTPKGGTLT